MFFSLVHRIVISKKVRRAADETSLRICPVLYCVGDDHRIVHRQYILAVGDYSGSAADWI